MVALDPGFRFADVLLAIMKVNRPWPHPTRGEGNAKKGNSVERRIVSVRL